MGVFKTLFHECFLCFQIVQIVANLTKHLSYILSYFPFIFYFHSNVIKFTLVCCNLLHDYLVKQSW